VYACEGFSCSPPQSSIEEALTWFEGATETDDPPDGAGD
jgi:hypothetical protein